MTKIDLNTIKKRTAAGIIALTSRTLILQVISLVAFSLLTVILTPENIGVYVAVTAIMRIVNFFTDFGFGAAIVQRKNELEERDLKTAFTIQMFTTLIIFLVVWFFQGNVQEFFRLSTAATQLLLALIFTLFLSSFKTIPSVLLERSLHFNKLIYPQIIEALVFNIVVVYLASRGFGVTSYTYSTLLAALAGIPFYYLVSPWKIGLGFSVKSFKVLFYGIQFQAKSILGTLKDDLLTTTLAKFLPFSQLGMLGWGQKWAFFSFRFVVDSITRVTFSTYSRLQEDKRTLASSIEKSLFATALVMFPILGGLMLTASFFLKFIPQYQKWEGGLVSLYFFSLNAAVSSLSNILVNVLDATGRVRTTLKLMVLWLFLTWSLTAIFVYLIGYNGVAVASFLVTLTIFITIRLVKQIVNFAFFQSIKAPLISVFVMAFAVYLFNSLFVTNIFWLAGSIVVGALVYGLVVWSLAKNQILDYLKLMHK